MTKALGPILSLPFRILEDFLTPARHSNNTFTVPMYKLHGRVRRRSEIVPEGGMKVPAMDGVSSDTMQRKPEDGPIWMSFPRLSYLYESTTLLGCSPPSPQQDLKPTHWTRVRVSPTITPAAAPPAEPQSITVNSSRVCDASFPGPMHALPGRTTQASSWSSSKPTSNQASPVMAIHINGTAGN